MGRYSLLQEIFPTQGLNPGLQHCRQTLYCLSLPDPNPTTFHPSRCPRGGRCSKPESCRQIRHWESALQALWVCAQLPGYGHVFISLSLSFSIRSTGRNSHCDILRVKLDSHSVVSNSLRPHGLHPTRLLCLWDSPGKNTGVGSHALLQGIFPIQGSNLGLLNSGRFCTV